VEKCNPVGFWIFLKYGIFLIIYANEGEEAQKCFKHRVAKNGAADVP
jgi:hypothetical protein